MKGLRYNKGKTDYSLIPPGPIEELAKVLSFGAEKYTIRDSDGNIIEDGRFNWKRGMPFSYVIASMKRHLRDFEQGKDYDEESSLPHLAHIMCNAAFLLEYMKIHPEFDDRKVWWKRPIKRVYLDIDGVLSDFEYHFLSKMGYDTNNHPQDWNDYRFREGYEKIANDPEFWSGIPSMVKPEEIDYPITGYCTSRFCPDEVTKKWLDSHEFPRGDFINVRGGSKGEALKGKCDVFVDDSIFNFNDVSSHGITCFLMTRPHNIKYDVGYFRVNSISEFFERVKQLW